MHWKMLCSANFDFFSILDCPHCYNHFYFHYALSQNFLSTPSLLSLHENKHWKCQASEATCAHFWLPKHKDLATVWLLQNTISDICSHCNPHLKLSKMIYCVWLNNCLGKLLQSLSCSSRCVMPVLGLYKKRKWVIRAALGFLQSVS